MELAEKAKWLKAIREEFRTLIELGKFFERKKVSKGTKYISSGIILELERDEEGLPTRFKARLFSLGKLHSDRFEYLRLYSPVA